MFPDEFLTYKFAKEAWMKEWKYLKVTYDQMCRKWSIYTLKVIYKIVIMHRFHFIGN